MAEIKVRQLTNPTPAELDTAAAVLAKAFESDSFVTACIGGNQDFSIPFQRSMISATAVGGGELYVASYGEHDIAGVAGWFGPGTGFMNTPEQGEAGFNALMASFSPDLMKWWTEYFLPKYEVQTTTALGEGTKLAAWHLQIIGVLPEHQGKGIGGALVRTVESKALPNGVACCLEAVNDAIVPIYAHWGYVDKGEEHYESLAGGSFPTYVMMKSPPGNAA